MLTLISTHSFSLNLETIYLQSYAFRDDKAEATDFREERDLSLMISTRCLDKLIEIVVPADPIDPNEKLGRTPRCLNLFKQSRQYFRETELIKSPKVKLRELGSGQTSEFET